jgi:hypothetical protein
MKPTLNLEIYIDSDCPNCCTSLDTAKWVRKQFPGLSIRVIDLKHSAEEVPEPIFAVPTYLLEGEPIFLGNPENQALRLRIEQKLNAVTDEPEEK